MYAIPKPQGINQPQMGWHAIKINQSINKVLAVVTSLNETR